MDWSEQDHHLSGALGAALAARLFELEWVARLPRTRAVRLTDDGRAGLAEQFGVAVELNAATSGNVARAVGRIRPGAYPR